MCRELVVRIWVGGGCSLLQSVKGWVADREGVPAGVQRLSCAGKLLDNHRTLCDYGIQGEATLLLSLSLQGGAIDFQNRHGSKPGSGGEASAQQSAIDRRERLRKLALETIDITKDPYFMTNHLGSYECRLCLTLHPNEGNYLAHTQGKRHQENLARRGACVRACPAALRPPRAHTHRAACPEPWPDVVRWLRVCVRVCVCGGGGSVLSLLCAV